MKRAICFAVLFLTCGCETLLGIAQTEAKNHRAAKLTTKTTCIGVWIKGDADIVSLGPNGIVPVTIEGAALAGYGQTDTQAMTGDSKDIHNPYLKTVEPVLPITEADYGEETTD